MTIEKIRWKLKWEETFRSKNTSKIRGCRTRGGMCPKGVEERERGEDRCEYDGRSCHVEMGESEVEASR